MALNPDYVLAPSLQEFFIDKDSGLPMAGGMVYFFEDNARTIPKDVFEISGTPPNYSYNVLPNPVILSAVGTFQDASGVDILPYYYPFDADGNVQLYFIAVYNSSGVLQFTREGFPNTTAEDVIIADQDFINFIPNGQFLAHNNWISPTEPPYVQYSYPVSGAQTVNAQPIAQGGWNFVYTNGTSATFNNSFSQIPSSGGWSINSFPKFIFNFVCTGIGNTPATRDLRIQWPDVNKFSSGNPPGTTPYTLFFDAKSNDSNTYIFELIKVYYFGTGGTPNVPIEEVVGNISIGPGNLAPQNINNIIFSANLGMIGTNGDDYVALSLRGPASGWNVSVSDFILAVGTETFTSFPVQTNDQMLSRGVAGWMPTPDPTGMNLYLPLILTPQGMTFDNSSVGEIVAKTQITALPNELLMNGATTYLTSGYSATGIPYRRLANYLLLNSPAVSIAQSGLTATLPANEIPMFGTGPNFVTLFLKSGAASDFFVQINTVTTGSASDVSTGWTFTATVANTTYTVVVTGVPTAGQYWTFTDGAAGLVYNVWYSVNGAGPAPTAPTGANIMVALVTADTIGTTITKTLAAVNQYQFWLPSLAGLFLRTLDPSATYDLDVASRMIGGIIFDTTEFTGAKLGSLELQAFLQHTHAGPFGTTFVTSGTGGDNIGTGGFTSSNQAATGNSSLGGTETRPVNFAVNYFMKY
jgi:hypothetical protein